MASTATTGFVLFDQFLPDVLQYVHGAPSIIVRNHVKNAIILFAQRSLVLRKEPAAFCFTQDQATYTLKYAKDRYRVISITDFRKESDESVLVQTTENDMDTQDAAWRYVSGTPAKYMLTPDVNKVRVYPIPDADGTSDMLIMSVVVPTRDQEEVDELFYEKWQNAITAGTLATLLLLPGATWYNPDLARFFSLEFKRGCNNARKITVSGTGVYPGTVYPIDFTTL
jgi:hypothetical protein